MGGGWDLMFLSRLVCDPAFPHRGAAALDKALARTGWVQLLASPAAMDAPDPGELPQGSGVLVASGGSSGARSLCAQPVSHLDRSATATGDWLRSIGLLPEQVCLFNPLPFHHMSGLMPWWRSRCWGTSHVWLSPAQLKEPSTLLESHWPLADADDQPWLLSLVPTQLVRLLADPGGVRWLQRFALIFVGGASLPLAAAAQARQAGIRLAPCYGATETAAMVSALPPHRFLAGENGCGDALNDVELRLLPDGALGVRTPRLAIGRWSPLREPGFSSLCDADGWWRSGDAADLSAGLRILGRLDGAVHSGGETVFPEQLESRLLQAAQQADLSVQALLILGVEDPEWGERLVALVRSTDPSVLPALQQLTLGWPVADRPRRWLECPELEPSAAGKWQRQRWRDWLRAL